MSTKKNNEALEQEKTSSETSLQEAYLNLESMLQRLGFTRMSPEKVREKLAGKFTAQFIPYPNRQETFTELPDPEETVEEDEPGETGSEAVEFARQLLLEAEQGDPDAQNGLAFCYYMGIGVEQDYEESIRWLRQSAGQGDASGCYNLGCRYYEGEMVEQDFAEAVRWWSLAAERGHALSQCRLGNCYRKGEGVEQDLSASFHWYSLSAERGSLDGQCNLGVSYSKGLGVDRDDKEAVRLFRNAGWQGHAQSQYSLGYCYFAGVGVRRNFREAYFWWLFASSNGSYQAARDIRWVEDKLTEKEREVALVKVSQWHRDHDNRDCS